MQFQRARSEEQKNIRINEIVDATIDLYEKLQYDKITLALIAKQLSFSRANLYKYVNTKEEIFLLIISRDIRTWSKEVIDFFKQYETLKEEEFCKFWAEILYRNKRIVELFCILNTIIARNVSAEKLADFKKQIHKDFTKIKKVVKKFFPFMNSEQLKYFIEYQMKYAVGVYPATIINDVQAKAIEISGIPSNVNDFESSFSKFLIVILNGIKAKL
ncbi:TetR/AcrR family transcriptional regulator [Clostridium felsineum]|uniref:Uncharacterized protein n=1 Tax=Clostridium felsineum TaxID=36839 RepID=A0A1S8LUD5_9CLOT|nr:TetR/AcrR family transcriptional regulator [Clostridium felsineum]URZ04535.1 hypothetical protein CLAUR_046240 [Clostridium felsineum]URZ09311.1 hypothetical protein CLROS_047270 [Clostridium felsineum]URZ13997.1 hypothetical protein CROST_047750 [Clostridium felsineum]URZ18763.1 hypothetical protein CLFE_048510 [Clostridium felsineum DSM 794]